MKTVGEGAVNLKTLEGPFTSDTQLTSLHSELDDARISVSISVIQTPVFIANLASLVGTGLNVSITAIQGVFSLPYAAFC